MVNSVFNQSTTPDIMSQKAVKEAAGGDAFQEMLTSLQNFDVSSNKAVPDTKTFQVEREAPREKISEPKPVKEREDRDVREREPRKVSEPKEFRRMSKEEITPSDIKNVPDASKTDIAQLVAEDSSVKPPETPVSNTTTETENAAIQNAANKVMEAQDRAIPLTKETAAAPPENTIPIKEMETSDGEEEAIKAQSTEVSAQQIASQTAGKAEVQQAQATVVNTNDASAKRTVNAPTQNSSVSEKIDKNAILGAEEGGGKQNLAGEEKNFGSNQQKAPEEAAPKLATTQATQSPQAPQAAQTPQIPVANIAQTILKQPSFKENITSALKVAAKTSEAVGNQTTTSDSQKATDIKLKTVADIERPKQAEKFAQSVGNTLRNMKFNPGKNEMTIRIDPPQLGKMKINVTLDQGKITTSIVAESQTVKNALESNMNLLKSTLEQGGLKLDNLNVTVNDGAKNEAGLEFGNNKGKNSNQDRNPGNQKEANSLDESEIEQYVNLSNYRLESKGVYFVSTTA